MPRHEPGQQRRRSWVRRIWDETNCCLDGIDCCDGPCLLATLNLTVLWRWLAGTFAPAAVDPHTAPPRSGGGRLAARFVRSYQLNVSRPRDRAVCPMQPTCSRYALQALSRHGLGRGGALVVRRLTRCGRAPGYDPVP